MASVMACTCMTAARFLEQNDITTDAYCAHLILPQIETSPAVKKRFVGVNIQCLGCTTPRRSSIPGFSKNYVIFVTPPPARLSHSPLVLSIVDVGLTTRCSCRYYFQRPLQIM